MKTIRALYTTNSMIIFWLSYTTFLFDFFLEASIYPYKNFVGFLVDLKTPKQHSKLTYLLQELTVLIYTVPVDTVKDDMFPSAVFHQVGHFDLLQNHRSRAWNRKKIGCLSSHIFYGIRICVWYVRVPWGFELQIASGASHQSWFFT